IGITPPTRYTRVPYTTLFRSNILGGHHEVAIAVHTGGGEVVGTLVVRQIRRKNAARHIEPREVELVRPIDGVGNMSPVHQVFRRSEEHTSELQSRENLVCRLL